MLAQIPATNPYIEESFVAEKIANSSPILSGISENYFQAFEEIISIKDQNLQDKDEYNRKCLDILLKYGIVKKDAVEELIDNGKLNVPGASDILEKYE